MVTGGGRATSVQCGSTHTLSSPHPATPSPSPHSLLNTHRPDGMGWPNELSVHLHFCGHRGIRTSQVQTLVESNK